MEPLSRFDDAHQRSAGRRLPAARLAHETERLALVDVEADTGDGAQLASVGAERDREVTDLKQWLTVVSRGDLLRVTGRGFQHAKAWPGSSAGSSSGRWVTLMSVA